MKKNKFVFVAIIFLAILLVQPQNFQAVVSIFTQNDLKSQLNITGSPGEKNSDHSKAQFTSEELNLEKGTWKKFSSLDLLNRVGVAEAMLGQDLLPKKEREDISTVTPTGWKNKKINFNGQSDYLYNRSHLIAFQLSGENDNPQNLFTGTRALNANFEDEKSSMLYYENLISDYIKETGHHVRYRVTPIFKNVELVCRGIRLEAQSVEDDTISFDVYIFNIQPGYELNYLTGDSQKVAS